jgi:hypothetical protein
MSEVRVLRIIEYVFENEEAAQQNIDRFTMNLSTVTMTMRSAILTELNWQSPNIELQSWGEEDVKPKPDGGFELSDAAAAEVLRASE